MKTKQAKLVSVGEVVNGWGLVIAVRRQPEGGVEFVTECRGSRSGFTVPANQCVAVF